MWVSRTALERIRELEAQLRDSVAGDVYRASLARVAELEKQNAEDRAEHARQFRWFSSMLLRRAGSMPLPPTPEERAEAVQHGPPPAPSDTAVAKAEAVIAEGRRLDASREDVERAVLAIPGITVEWLAQNINGRVM